jgi:hypothetical protein
MLKIIITSNSLDVYDFKGSADWDPQGVSVTRETLQKWAAVKKLWRLTQAEMSAQLDQSLQQCP